MNVIYGSDLSFLPYLVVMAGHILSLNGNCLESWRELGRRSTNTLWFALGRSGGVTLTTLVKQIYGLSMMVVFVKVDIRIYIKDPT